MRVQYCGNGHYWLVQLGSNYWLVQLGSNYWLVQLGSNESPTLLELVGNSYVGWLLYVLAWSKSVDGSCFLFLYIVVLHTQGSFVKASSNEDELRPRYYEKFQISLP